MATAFTELFQMSQPIALAPKWRLGQPLDLMVPALSTINFPASRGDLLPGNIYSWRFVYTGSHGKASD